MKKILVISLILIISLIVGFYFYNANIKSSSKDKEQNNTIISRTSEIKSLNNTDNSSSGDSSTNTKQEIEISNFSTKIYTKEASRQNNLSITCSTLDGSIVKAGEVFSFTDTVGPASPSRGYQKADIFDKNGNKKKGFGGGNCQVSTTLYNAVLNTPNLPVIERHEHSNKVPYIETGKDAAVAYGSVDLKFKNANDFDIKIACSTDKDYVYITLYKIQ